MSHHRFFKVPVRLAALGAVLGLAPVAQAGDVFTLLVSEGQSVDGVGLITRFDNLAVNIGGNWIVEVDTDNANADIDGALLFNGVLLLQEGGPIEPSPATIDSFDAILLNNGSDSFWNLFLDGTTGTGDDSGLYLNDTLVLQEGTISTATGFSPDTPYIGFFETKMADQVGDTISGLVMASVDDIAIESSVDRALVVFDIDANTGTFTETVLYKEGDVLPGQTETVADFGTGPHNFDYNNAGDVMYFADLNGDTAVDGAIYINDTLLAQEGDEFAPLAPRAWSSLSSPELSLNDFGDYVFSGSLDGDTASNLIIVKNGEKLAQEGDAPPGIGGSFLLTSFGSGPILIDNQSNVFWFGDWDDSDTTRDTAIFRNDTPIVQEGVTQIDGRTVTSLAAGVQDGFAISDNGRYLIFECAVDGNDAVVLVTFDETLTLRDPDPGLAGTLNTLATAGSDPGDEVYFVYSLTAGSRAVPGCPGLSVDLGAPQILGSSPANSAGNASLAANVPGAASGRTVLIQAVNVTDCIKSNLVTYTFP